MEHGTQPPASDFQKQPVRNYKESIINRRHKLPSDIVAVADKSKAAPRRWSRARALAAKIGRGLSQNEKAQKLALPFWLEAIDPWHRNGKNLDVYYVEWLHSKSEQSFFHWLEIGDGKDMDLMKCPRSLLEKERITYLAPWEREAYEIIVRQGKLMQKQTGKPLNTIGGGKWIFVLSPSRVMYVGLKKKGEFHHSSFLAGAPTIASGRLLVHDGQPAAVWPYSSSYTPTETNFGEFISFLKENNLDLSNLELMATGESTRAEHRTTNIEISHAKTFNFLDQWLETEIGVLQLLQAEWVFLSVGVVLEIVLMAMDQCANRDKPGYSLVAMVASFVAILICLIDLWYKAVKQGVRMKRQGMKFGFHYPAASVQRPFYSFVDIFSLLSAITQFILSLVAYSFYRRHADNPINLSVVSIIFILCIIYSRLTSSRSRSVELVRDTQV